VVNTQNKFIVLTGAISGFILMALALLAVGNIIGRSFGHPIPGTYEIIGWLAAISMGAGVAYTQAHEGHVNIDFLLTRVPIRAKAGIQVIIYVLSATMFVILVWKLCEYGMGKKASGATSLTLRAPVYPWIYALGAAMAVTTIILIYQLFRHVMQLIKG